MLRTAEQFDEWFSRSGGDPWGYDSPSVQDRLDASLEFISEQLGDFRGTFVEIGAFRGAFTARLASRFPDAAVIAVDISAVALRAAYDAIAGLENVQLHQADMAEFVPPENLRAPAALVMLECIYYLPAGERFAAIGGLADRLARPRLFLSCPVTGDPYPTERDIARWLSHLQYRQDARRVLNRLPGRWWRPAPNQVIYSAATIS